jgi:hypothetical protein
MSTCRLPCSIMIKPLAIAAALLSGAACWGAIIFEPPTPPPEPVTPYTGCIEPRVLATINALSRSRCMVCPHPETAAPASSADANYFRKADLLPQPTTAPALRRSVAPDDEAAPGRIRIRPAQPTTSPSEHMVRG